MGALEKWRENAAARVSASMRVREPAPVSDASHTRAALDDRDEGELDVPAAVVCARCGESECICGEAENEATRSGVVAIVPWERGHEPGAILRRLWTTAHATTFDADTFFERMPDGPVAPALRFAVLSELAASTASAICVLPFLVAFAPRWASHIVHDGAARDLALRMLFLAIPSFALLLVLAHVAHGLSLDRGARASGATRSPSRALRFGLYATGWDILLGPIGAVVLLIKGGPKAFGKLMDVSIGLPGRSSRAFLRGTYRLDGAAQKGALARSYAVAATATVIGAIFVIAGAVAAAIVIS